jgi:hypothetical protein
MHAKQNTFFLKIKQINKKKICKRKESPRQNLAVDKLINAPVDAR